MTYGQISQAMDRRISAAAVGWALHGCPEDVPWHRVVNAQGRCSTDSLAQHPPGWQRSLLEQEGVEFSSEDRIDLARFRWHPDD